MNGKRQQQLWEIVAPRLGPDESVEVLAVASVGSVAMTRKLATAVVVGIASAGTMIANVKPRPMYIALTDRRILFFDGATASGRPGKNLMELPRELVSASAPEGAALGLAMRIQLTVQSWEKDLQITFPHVSKADGRAFAAALSHRN